MKWEERKSTSSVRLSVLSRSKNSLCKSNKNPSLFIYNGFYCLHSQIDSCYYREEDSSCTTSFIRNLMQKSVQLSTPSAFSFQTSVCHNHSTEPTTGSFNRTPTFFILLYHMDQCMVMLSTPTLVLTLLHY